MLNQFSIYISCVTINEITVMLTVVLKIRYTKKRATWLMFLQADKSEKEHL